MNCHKLYCPTASPSQTIAIGLVAVALFVGSMTAHAADFSAGYKAYLRGDYATALRIFRQFADQGNTEAQLNLGTMYDRGQGVPQDYKEAVQWYRKAAEQGNTDGQYSIGDMYSQGRGVPQDYVLAHMWYNLAAAKFNSRSRRARDNVAKMMSTEQIAEAQRLAREWKPKGR